MDFAGTNFLSQLVDWKGFELFVADLYSQDAEIIVQHNVTEIGKSQAKRQIDVLVLQKIKFHTIKIIVECKLWKNKVDRHVIDVLAASVEDLNANKGVIFTTIGYEEGAVQYAKSKNIDIFIVRDLTADEWGKPGRHILLYLQMFYGELQNLKINNPRFLSENNLPPNSLNISIGLRFNKEQLIDPKYNLVSINKKAKANLVGLFEQTHQSLLKQLFDAYKGLLQPADKEIEVAYNTPVVIDFSNQEYRYLIHEHGLISFDSISFDFLRGVTQSKIEFDRANSIDFVLIVENYITNQKNYISKAKNEATIKLSDPVIPVHSVNEDDIVQNGSVIKITTTAEVGFKSKPITKIIKTEPININLNII